MLEAEVVEGLALLAAPVPEGTLAHWRRFGVPVGAMEAYQQLAVRTLWAYCVSRDVDDDSLSHLSPGDRYWTARALGATLEEVGL